jgi:hypothetical protein
MIAVSVGFVVWVFHDEVDNSFRTCNCPANRIDRPPSQYRANMCTWIHYCTCQGRNIDKVEWVPFLKRKLFRQVHRIEENNKGQVCANVITDRIHEMDESELQELLESENLLDEIDLDKILETQDAVMNKIVDVEPYPKGDTKEEKLLFQQIHDEIRLERKQTQVDTNEFQHRIQKLKDFKVASKKPKPEGTIPKAIDLSEFRDETYGWCCICNEDGRFICLGCDEDIYCMRCFKEGHQDDVEYRLHKFKEFVR